MSDAAGQYSNQFIRPAGDLLGQEYNRGVPLMAQWNALGGGSNATQVMASALQTYAQQMLNNQSALIGFELMWRFGQTVVPNTSATLNDGSGPIGSGGDNRQQITGQQAWTLVSQWRSRVNWLGSAGFVTTTPLTDGGANLDTVIACAQNPSAANCGNLINRITELKTQYEANSNAVLNAIEQVAVNVR